MNAILEIVVIAAAVGIAALFVALRIVKAIQGGRPACCPDTGEAGKLARDSSCADSDADGSGGRGSDGRGSNANPKPRPSYCAGCTGCGPRG